MGTIYVTRHGQREDSDAGGNVCPAARPCDPDITGMGRQQATETGKALAGLGISVVYSSPFLRTARTASLIARECEVKVRLEWGLAEWFRSDWWREWPGTIHPDVLQRMLGNIEAWEPTGIFPKLLGEDDFWQASDRYVKTAFALAGRHVDGSIAIVTHGPALACITAGLTSWNEPGVSSHRQCGITKLVLRDGKWVAEMVNDVGHLSHVET